MKQERVTHEATRPIVISGQSADQCPLEVTARRGNVDFHLLICDLEPHPDLLETALEMVIPDEIVELYRNMPDTGHHGETTHGIHLTNRQKQRSRWCRP